MGVGETDSTAANSPLDHSTETQKEELDENLQCPKLLTYLKGENTYNMDTFIIPNLSPSGLFLKDIFYEKSSISMKQRNTLLQKVIHLVAARDIPQIQKDWTKLKCFVRMCLHDGNKILSNIHTVRAKSVENSSKMWSFALKIPHTVSCVEDGELFIRSDCCTPTLGIFFELSISYCKQKLQQSHSIELSCGWAFMKLLDDSGMPIKSKTKVLKVHDSEPFVAHSVQITSPDKPGLLKKVLTKQKPPRLVVSISNADQNLDQYMSYLPSSLVGSVTCLPFLVLMRKIFMDDVLNGHILDSTDPIFSPTFASASELFSQHDIIDVIREEWTKVLKMFSSQDMKLESLTKRAFRNLFLETAYLLIQSNILPVYDFEESENERKKEIKKMIDDYENQGKMKPEQVPLSLHLVSRRIVY